MPRLPDVTALGARPVPQGRRGIAQQDTEVAGLGIARFGATLGAEGLKAVEEYQRQEDRTAALAFRTSMNDWEAQNIHDPENGLARTRGKDAFGISEKATKSFDEFVGKQMETASSARQRSVFNEMAQSRRAQIGTWAMGHEAQQRKVYADGQFVAALDSSAERAASTAAEVHVLPEGRRMQAAQIEAEIAAAQRLIANHMQGASTEEIASKTAKFASAAHAGVVSSMLTAGNTEQAKDYLAKHGAAIDQRQRDLLTKGVREATDRARVQAFGDEIEAGLESGSLTVAQALDKARAKFGESDPAREQAVQQVKQRALEVEAVKSKAQKELDDTAQKIIINGGTRRDISPDMWARMSPEAQRFAIDYAEARWRRAKADAEGKKTEDWSMYMMLTDMANDNPEKFLDPMTLQTAEPHLSKEQMRSLVNIRTAISKRDAQAMRSLKVVDDTVKSIKSEIVKAGIDLTPKEGTKKAADTAQFMGELKMALQAATEAKGSPLSPNEANEIGLGLLREGYERGTGIFFDDKKRRYQVPRERAGEFIVKKFDDIPQAVRDEIIADQFPGAKRSIYGDRAVVLDAEQKKRVETIYTNGVSRGMWR